MKTYEPRPAGRHVRSPNGKLVREGDFTDPNATPAPPAEQKTEADQAPVEQPATPSKTKGK